MYHNSPPGRKRDSVTQVIIERPVTEAEYTSRAWAVDYNQLRNNPDLHNGRTFVFKGTVEDIQSMGDKNRFTLDISDDPSPHSWSPLNTGQCFHTNRSKTQSFGNRWGNYEEKPRFLAKFIYDN